MESSTEKRAYNKFRKLLIQSGFMMMQKSVYCKLSLNTSSSNAISEMIKRNKPEKGLIQILTVTEKQYSKIEIVIGEMSSEVINSDERTVIL